MAIYVRIAKGVRDHFTVRRSEWGSAFGLAYVGIAFATPGNTLDIANLRNLSAIMPEGAWAALCLTLGLVRLIVLTLNGTFAHTKYGHYSPHVRAATAFVGCMVWGGMAFGVLTAPSSWTPPISILMGLLTIQAAQDAFNWRGALAEAGAADREKRYGRT